MTKQRCVGFLLGCLLLLSGSALGLAAPAAPATGAGSDGTLTSGRYTSRQGTLHYHYRFRLNRDGTVTETQSVEGTDRFAEFWRERYARLENANSEYKFSKNEENGRLVVSAEKQYPTVTALNEGSNLKVRLMESPLFRSVSLKGETDSFDMDAMVTAYGSDDSATHEDWTEFLREAVTVSYLVDDEVTGQTYAWNRTAGQVGGGVPVLIEAKQWRPWAYWAGGATAAFLLFVIYMGIFGRRHWEPQEI